MMCYVLTNQGGQLRDILRVMCNVAFAIPTAPFRRSFS